MYNFQAGRGKLIGTICNKKLRNNNKNGFKNVHCFFFRNLSNKVTLTVLQFCCNYLKVFMKIHFCIKCCR